MTLQERLALLIAAIGADIKALQNVTQNQYSASTSNQTISGNTDTYVAGSTITIPTGKVKIGSRYRVKISVTKTAAGTAAPIINIRIGTAGSNADTARVTHTLPVQTGVADEGVFEVDCTFRVAGASAVIQAIFTSIHRQQVTGLSTVTSLVREITSAAFDVTGAGLKIGASVNPGASAVWTVVGVSAELINLTP